MTNPRLETVRTNDERTQDQAPTHFAILTDGKEQFRLAVWIRNGRISTGDSLERGSEAGGLWIGAGRENDVNDFKASPELVKGIAEAHAKAKA